MTYPSYTVARSQCAFVASCRCFSSALRSISCRDFLDAAPQARRYCRRRAARLGGGRNRLFGLGCSPLLHLAEGRHGISPSGVEQRKQREIRAPCVSAHERGRMLGALAPVRCLRAMSKVGQTSDNAVQYKQDCLVCSIRSLMVLVFQMFLVSLLKLLLGVSFSVWHAHGEPNDSRRNRESKSRCLDLFGFLQRRKALFLPIGFWYNSVCFSTVFS